MLVALLALIAPWLAVRIPRIRVPVAVIEILLGLLFGRSGLHLLRDTPVLHFLSLFGLSYLMFLSGLEIDLRRLFSPVVDGSTDLKASFLVVFLSVSVAILVSFFLARLTWVHDPVALAVLLVAGAPTVVLPALKERGHERLRFGQLTLTTTILADILSLTGITVLVAVTKGGTVRVLLALLLFLPFLLMLRFAGPLQRLWLRRAEQLVTGQIDVRGALAVITVFIAAAQVLGTATVLGAFMAGLIVSVLFGEGKEPAQQKLDVLGYGYFVPFFFIMLGAQASIGTALAGGHLLLLVLVLLLATFAISFLPALLLRFLLRWKETLAAALLLSTRLSATLAGAAVLSGAGLIRTGTDVALIGMCLLSAVLYPPIAGALAPKPPERRQEEAVVLAGDDPILAHLVDTLRRRGRSVTLYTDGGVSTRPPAGNVLGIFCQTAALRERLIEQLVPQRLWERVVVEAKPEELADLRARGFIPFVRDFAPYITAEALLVAPSGFQLWTGSDDQRLIGDLPVTNPRVWQETLRDLRLPASVLVVAITRGPEHIIPRGDTRLQPGDVVTVMATPEAMEETRRRLMDSPDAGARRESGRLSEGGPGGPWPRGR